MVVYFILNCGDKFSLMGNVEGIGESGTLNPRTTLVALAVYVAMGVVCGVFGVIFVIMVEVRLLDVVHVIIVVAVW